MLSFFIVKNVETEKKVVELTETDFENRLLYNRY